MAGAAKEKDLRPISDRISGTMRRFLLEDLRRSWGTVRRNQIKNVCWLLELQDLEGKCGNFKFDTGRNRQPMKLVKQWRNMIRSLG